METNSNTVLVCGAVLFDVTGHYPQPFPKYRQKSREVLLQLDVTVSLTDIQLNFGGCAVNIAYNLKLLGAEPLPLGVVGLDFNERYKDHLENMGIDTTFIHVDSKYKSSARSLNIIDSDGKQFSVSSAGASGSSEVPSPKQIACDRISTLAVVASDVPKIMKRHAGDLEDMRIPFIFSPGPDIVSLGKGEIERMIALSDYVILNDLEWDILLNRIAQKASCVVSSLSGLIITRGSDGSQLHMPEGTVIDIPCARVKNALDPVGCGDAYVAGFAFGLLRGLDLSTSARVGSLAATFNLEATGTQSHFFTLDEFKTRFCENFGHIF